ncbi:hypothetical protein EGM63_07150 [Mycobacterium avium subsp. paratuberculosis]|uniref:hypothetical protein n=1 Tax=Mycobacterium avium TaxID=1764 RepID=UPI0002A6BC7C|nr:hypothetical protein [Mycobacterium avium]ELP44515.1 hypothetical protein D522_21883 [Mycobacterium avium subsp. paratuberculosis S5]AJK76949.1 hypothetical protein RC58_19600 [Mycobacterium avium subsp. paratuberculosis]AZA69133.1 hypothetical protein EGM63_07150 [Mycobacterium avium subsp. paratuberculosis]AZB12373.1 hypothetical protein EGM64_02425 [Mycobacterium avium subsp. paratuberculosis]AZB40389.1 hypothetical protein EGM60_22295 [Mycobacterium avium subsp. paratuberculosis]
MRVPTPRLPIGISGLAGAVSTIGAVASNGPRDEFHNQLTQHADFGMSQQPPTGELPPPGFPPDRPEGFEQPGNVDPFDQQAEPTPWYRRPAMLIAWVVSVVVLIGLIVFGVIELIGGQQGVSHVPKSTTSTTTTTTTTTTPTTTTTTTTTPSSTSPGSSAEQPPAQQPSQQPGGGQTQQPSHHHRLPQLPPVITIPQVPTVITVPPGLR